MVEVGRKMLCLLVSWTEQIAKNHAQVVGCCIYLKKDRINASIIFICKEIKSMQIYAKRLHGGNKIPSLKMKNEPFKK